MFEKTEVDWDTGCFKFVGSKDPRGYGKIYYNGKSEYAHRLSWLLQVGEIPEGKVIRHICDNPSCVAVEHLELGTQQDNVKDMHERGRANPAFAFSERGGKPQHQKGYKQKEKTT